MEIKIIGRTANNSNARTAVYNARLLARATSARQMGRTVEEPGLPLPIINDGRVVEHNLQLRGLSREWLRRQMAEHSVSRAEDVFLLSVDELGRVYFVAKEGRGA